MPQLSFEGNLVNSTPQGQAVLLRPSIQEALQAYHGSENPEKVVLPNAVQIGEGKFSNVFVVDDIALKISSPHSGYQAAEAGQPSPVEDLSVQFVTLSSLCEYIQGNSEGVSVPQQFFVTSTPYGAYVLGQQYMDGWVSVERRTFEEYGSSDTIGSTAIEEIGNWSIAMAYRLKRAFGDFPRLANINDLVGMQDNVISMHGGNILVPAGSTLRHQPPICVIDQPAPYEKSISTK